MPPAIKFADKQPLSQPRIPLVWGFVFGWVFVCVVVVLNLFALGAAWQDKSYGALAIAILYGPIGNILLALFALVAIPLLRRKPSFSMARHLAFSCGAPACAIVVDFVVIFSMGLHGC